MKRVLTIFLLLASLLPATAVEIPEVIPVVVEITHVYFLGGKCLGRNLTHEIHYWPKFLFTRVYGPLTEFDYNQYSQSGMLRRQLVLHHVTL